MHLNRPCKFAALFASCTQLSYLKPLKAQLIVHGFFKQDTVVGDFIRRCIDLGDPQSALSTLSRINPTLFLQNLTIRCLHDHELYQDVVVAYKFFQSSSCPSDNFTFPFVIKAFSALKAIQNCKEIHCVILRTGFDQNVVVQTALVDFYAKIGEISLARKLHDEITQPDLVSWNALLSGYSLHGLNQEVFEVFGRIRLTNLNPNVSTFASLIPVCSRLEDSRIGKSFHGHVFKCGYFNDFLIPAFISMYGSKNELSVARDLFDSVPKKNVTMWNAMISAYTQSLKPYDAIELFRKMTLDHVKPNMITFMSIVPSCEIVVSIDYGESLHSYVIKLGFQNQPAVATIILSMYAKFRHLNSAKFLFNHMTQRNLLAWNSMVSGYVYNECWTMSLVAFRSMQADGFNPDAVSIISILSACSGLKATLLGQSAHSFSLRRGMDSNLHLSNALVAFYINCHKMSYSFQLFERMVIKDDVSWNTLISGCVHNGEDENAVLLLQIMQKKGVKLDSVTLISVLPCFKNLENLVQGMAVHGCAIKLGIAFDVSLDNTLISMYMNCGELDKGKMIFDEIPDKDVVSWNVLITGYHLHGLEKEGIDLFAQMVKDDHSPNYVTLLNVLSMCYSSMQVKSIHAYAARRWNIMAETSFITSLISTYGRFNEVSSSYFLFQMAEKGDISVWNAIVAVLVELDHARMAVSLFSCLLRTEVQSDYITILSLTSACGQLNHIDFTNSIMGYVLRKGIDKYVAVSNAFIDLHARSGNISYAKKVFDEMPLRDVISWSTMISGYGSHGNGEAALALFTQMKDSGFQPDEATYTSILSACSHTGLVDQGRMVFEWMLKDTKILPRMEHYACMVDLLGRTGHLKEAYDVVRRLPFEPSISILESVLGSCLNHGDIEVGERIGRLITARDVTNSGTYVMLYNVYAAAGMWSEANKVRRCMEAKNLKKLRGFSFIEGQRSC
ncbi:pentatricopeptide repeat-containing protein At5g39350-like [Cynara cardunculus var. scolymus]|uniref:Pentatricopeptide repeat-containing protein n=1 Tax=Cynara cardunculus var. scolymus TaxID=59895 RepID=A0A118K5G4_CYNCS|nr:pentatricopeptide repeat-containing protein At5g39350-like [Cynara cardunculus var. scolymus]KVI09058.1 Pentatricopeptide repeat-containing protein [Cynara cardunculus var. scolymus]